MRQVAQCKGDSEPGSRSGPNTRKSDGDNDGKLGEMRGSLHDATDHYETEESGGTSSPYLLRRQIPKDKKKTTFPKVPWRLIRGENCFRFL